MEPMTENSRTPQETQDRPEAGQESAQKPRIEFNFGRLAAGALAAVTAAALGSRLGVAGTLVGTAVISLVSGAASVLYQRSLERTRSVVVSTKQRIADNGVSVTRVLRVERGTTDEPERGAGDQATEQFPVDADGSDAAANEHGPRGVWSTLRSYVHSPGRRWVLAGAGALLTFVVALGVVAGLELLRGESLSGQAHGTTVGAIFGGGTGNHPAPVRPAPTTSGSSTPSAPVAPSGSATTGPGNPRPTTAPSGSSAPSSAPTPSPSTAPTTPTPTPSAPSPSGSVTPGG